jgi:hypothetical protein
MTFIARQRAVLALPSSRAVFATRYRRGVSHDEMLTASQ